MDTEPAPTQAAMPDDATEHVTAWSLDDADANVCSGPSRRWLFPIAVLVASIGAVGVAMYALLGVRWTPTPAQSANTATRTPTPAAAPPSALPTPEIPYWPDGA